MDMAYLFLVVGILLMVVFFRDALGHWALPQSSPGLVPAQPEQWGEKVEVLEAKIDLLTETLGEATEHLARIDRGMAVQHRQVDSPGEVPFAKVVEARTHQALQAKVYTMADAGMDVADIARELNRGKGEIELVLSLRR